MATIGMSKTNKYGQISGGYLYDALDRLAQGAIKTDLPYVMTKTAQVKYLRQCCDEEDIGFVINKVAKTDKNEWTVDCSAQTISKPILNYCKIRFVFVGKDHQYCILRG